MSVNPFKREIKHKLRKKKENLRSPFIKVSSSLPNCWIAYCEYGKVCITNDENMLRITVAKKNGRQEQHLTCKLDKHKNKNFRVYYSNKNGVVDVIYRYPFEHNTFISEMLNSITNLKKNDFALTEVYREYEKRFFETFSVKNQNYYYKNENEIKPIDSLSHVVWKLIYPMSDKKNCLKGRPPICFHRSIRSHSPKDFTKKFFGKAPRSLVKAVMEHIPFDKNSINSLFLARCFFKLWSLDNVVEFLYLSKESPQKPFIYSGETYDTASAHSKVNLYQNVLRKFTHRKIINWYKKYPIDFGMYLRDTVNQLEEIKKRNIKVRLSKKMDIKQIHDIISKIYNKLEREEMALPVYESLYPINNTDILGHNLVFPKTSYDLINWGVELNNCVGSYDHRVKSGRSIIFSLERDSKPVYCVEFSPTSNRKGVRMIQCKGNHNADAPDEIMKKCIKVVESALNSDKMKLFYPPGHEVKEITKDIDLEALENIESNPLLNAPDAFAGVW